MHTNVTEQSEASSRQRTRLAAVSLILLGALVVAAFVGGMRRGEESPLTHVNVETMAKSDVNTCLSNKWLGKWDVPFPTGTPPAGQYITGMKVGGGPGWVVAIEVWYNNKPMTSPADFTYGSPRPNLWTDSFECAAGQFINKLDYNMAPEVGPNQYGELINLVPYCSNGQKAPVTNTGGQIGSAFLAASSSCSIDLPGPLTGFSGTTATISATFAFFKIRFEAYASSTCTYSNIQTAMS